MRCRRCQRGLSGKEGVAWHKIKNDAGKTTGLHCNKCFWIVKKKDRYADDTTPDVYTAAVAEQDEKWSDWREPTEVEL